ncbi:MAG: hypothetical protein ACEPOZ_14690 [Marinifilaceae bacterium]
MHCSPYVVRGEQIPAFSPCTSRFWIEVEDLAGEALTFTLLVLGQTVKSRKVALKFSLAPSVKTGAKVSCVKIVEEEEENKIKVFMISLVDVLLILRRRSFH